MVASDPVSHVRQLPDELYLVDYDLPRGNERRRFYRAIQRYLREHLMEETDWSTKSVVYTEDVKFAFFVQREAVKVGGVAHVWKAKRVYEEPREAGETG